MLIFVGILNFFAALLHLGCIIYGASWYRFLGAGNEMIKLVEEKRIRPALITGLITVILLSWSLYDLSAANVIPPLPFVKFMLYFISVAYITRGVIGFASQRFRLCFTGNSETFWRISSSICLIIGIIHSIGIYQLYLQSHNL